MKRFSVLVICGVLVITTLSGCQENLVRPEDRPVLVEIYDDGEFPQSMVGTWRAEEASCELTFEPDGNISSAVIALGRTRVVPGQTTTVPMREDGKGIYKPGQWVVTYSPVTQELSVEIVMEYLHLEFGDHLLEGNSKELFIGTVPQDGDQWQAEWVRMPNYVSYTPERTELPIAPEEMTRPITFKKVPVETN